MAMPNADEIFSKAEQLAPINELTAKSLRLLCSKASVTQIAKRGRILPQNEYRWLTFLLSGELAMINEKNETTKLDAGSNRAKQPIFIGGFAESSAQVVSPAVLARFEKEQFELLLKQQQKSSRVIEIRVNDADNAVFDRVYDAFQENRLQLPSCPEVAFKVRDAINRKDVGVSEVSHIIQADQVLTARLMQVANSAMYKRGAEAKTLTAAIGRLGLEATKNLAFVLAIKQVFNSKSAVLRKSLVNIYKYSTDIAVMAFALARQIESLDQERALLAGLVHNIGSIPILHYADQCGDLFSNAEAVDASVKKLSPLLGGWVLEKFNFDEELTLVPETCHLWERDESSDIDYASLVAAAILLYNQGRDIPDSDLPLLDRLPVGQTLKKYGIDVASGHSLLESAKDDLVEMRQLLR